MLSLLCGIEIALKDFNPYKTWFYTFLPPKYLIRYQFYCSNINKLFFKKTWPFYLINKISIQHMLPEHFEN